MVGTGTALKAGAVLVFATIGDLDGDAVGMGRSGLARADDLRRRRAARSPRGHGRRAASTRSSRSCARRRGRRASSPWCVGLPALRLRGLYLAVVTLALALAASAPIFNNAFVGWIPVGTFDRPDLFGRVSLDSATRVYYLALVGWCSRSSPCVGSAGAGRGGCCIAPRDNERGVASYGDERRAGEADGLRHVGVHRGGGRRGVRAPPGVVPSPTPTARTRRSPCSSPAVIGGLGTITGALLGAVYLRGAQWLLPGQWQILATSAGVLVVLMVMPDGLAGHRLPHPRSMAAVAGRTASGIAAHRVCGATRPS